MAVSASYISPGTYYPEDLLVRDADWVSPGVVTSSDLTCTASTTALQVTISGSAENAAGGNAWAPGGYRLNNSAALALALAAPSTTYSRIDLVEAGVDTTVNPYNPTIRVVTGTPAATPVAPSPDAGFIGLWQVLVPANATAPSTLTDVRPIAGPSWVLAKMAAADGIATLDGTGNVPASQLANATVAEATASVVGTVLVAQTASGAATATTRGGQGLEEAITTANAWQTIATVTPAANGLFRVQAFAEIPSGGATLAVQVTFTDVAGAETLTILPSQTMAQGPWSSLAALIPAYTTAPIDVQVMSSSTSTKASAHIEAL